MSGHSKIYLFHIFLLVLVWGSFSGVLRVSSDFDQVGHSQWSQRTLRVPGIEPGLSGFLLYYILARSWAAHSELDLSQAPRSGKGSRAGASGPCPYSSGVVVISPGLLPSCPYPDLAGHSWSHEDWRVLLTAESQSQIRGVQPGRSAQDTSCRLLIPWKDKLGSWVSEAP